MTTETESMMYRTMSKKEIAALIVQSESFLKRITEYLERVAKRDLVKYEAVVARYREVQSSTVSRIADLKAAMNLPKAPLSKLRTCYGCGQQYRDTDSNRVNAGERLEARCCPHCGRVRYQSWAKQVNSVASVVWGFGRRKWRL